MTTTVDKRVETPPASRVYAAGVSAVLGVHLLLWLIIMVGGWLYWDDFILQGQAARLGLSADLLLNNHDGHVMPATYAVVWVIQELSGLNYTLVAVTMLVGEAAFLTAAVVAFTVLLGRGGSTVLALAVFLLSPIMYSGLTWWSAALTLVPLMTCALFATVSHVRYVRTGSTSALLTTFALVVVALSFFEKSLLIVLWLFLLTALVDPSPGVRTSLRRALTDHWRLWSAWAALLVVYLLAFAQVAEGRTHLPTGPGQVVELVRRALFQTIAPGLIGGPVQWTAVDYTASFADPPPVLVVVGSLALAAVVLAGVRRPGVARKAWVVAALYLAADLTTFAVGRLGPAGDPGVIQAGRYVATAMIGISIAIGTTALTHRDRLSDPRLRWPLFGVAAAVSLLAVISTLAYAAIWSKNPAQPWVDNARQGLAQADAGSPLLDQDVPDFILLPVTHPYNQASWFLAPLPDQPGFSSSTDVLQVLDNRGRLVPARIDGPSALPAVDGCYVVEAGSRVEVPLEHALIPWLHTVGLTYRAAGPGFISVAIGSGDPVTTEVLAGEHSAYVRAEGGDSTITVTSSDTAVCVSAAEVGAVVPRDLNYGGDEDLTDQLQRLG